MNKSGKIALIALLTVACGAGGYFATDYVLDNNAGKTNGANAGGSSPGIGAINNVGSLNAEDNTAITGKSDIEINSEVASEPEINEPVKTSGKGSDIVPTITSVSKPAYNASSNKYSFNVVADGQDLKYVLTSYNGTVLKTQDSGAFTVDPVPNTGRYLVYVSNTSGTKSETVTVSGCVVVYEKLTAAQIQTAFNSGDYMEG